ncbi:MAG: hypothetical protein LAT76_11790 [Schleiferiaceae bacterium]|nr:hypothetical protein [Schleiferiaceae bacterium]
MKVLVAAFILIIFPSCQSYEKELENVFDLEDAVMAYFTESNLLQVNKMSFNQIYFSTCISCKGCEEKMVHTILKNQEKSAILLVVCRKENYEKFKTLGIKNLYLDETVFSTYSFSSGLPLETNFNNGILKSVVKIGVD